MIARILIALAIAFGVIATPSVPPMQRVASIQCTCDLCEWQGYYSDAYSDYADEFTALFDSYETKWAKNGRLMIRSGSSGRYSFAKSLSK